ncbi:hypothetical protein LWI29_007562 [Acer saccharum]|uniref:Uncharacterized protein n=1 Tax=Acer saccharum TaxID=4024 RepID=A0AA39SG36_ACESA|nr:hypothetical protein LWI29_007562 [Acer saccharum]
MAPCKQLISYLSSKVLLSMVPIFHCRVCKSSSTFSAKLSSWLLMGASSWAQGIVAAHSVEVVVPKSSLTRFEDPSSFSFSGSFCCNCSGLSSWFGIPLWLCCEASIILSTKLSSWL